jgi:hypothetical protein
MLYYSEKLNQKFKTVEELEKAEAKAEADANLTEKELAAKVEEESNNYEMAKGLAKNLRKEADDIMAEARERYFNAISEYNKRFGPLITTGTSDTSHVTNITDMFHDLFKF